MIPKRGQFNGRTPGGIPFGGIPGNGIVLAEQKPAITLCRVVPQPGPYFVPVTVDVPEPDPTAPNDPTRQCLSKYAFGGMTKRLELVKAFTAAMLQARGGPGNFDANDDEEILERAFRLAEKALLVEAGKGPFNPEQILAAQSKLEE